MKTIKQLADELGVSKTAIRKRLTSEFRTNYVETTENGVLVITANGCAIIAETLQTSANPTPETPETEVSGSAQETIAFLMRQCEEKDRQIEALTKALSDAQKLTDQAQQLQAKQVMELQAPKKLWPFGGKKKRREV